MDGTDLAADLVIDASGRAGRVTRSLRPAPASGGPCGIAYVNRQYQLHPGAEPGPLMSPIAWQADLDGYQAIIFLHEYGIFSVLLVRPTADPVLSQLRHEAAFSAACQAIPGLADWVDPARSRPITPVLPGGPLLNAYRGQTGPDGHLALPGLVFVGDAVATTTPTFGRGITTTVLQAQQLLQLIDEHGTDTDAIGESFDAWCTEQIKPWVRRPRPDGRSDPAPLGRRGHRPEPASAFRPHPRCHRGRPQPPRCYRRLPAHDPLPSSLRAVEPRARALYANGWRPSPAPGPSRSELADIVRIALHRYTAQVTVYPCAAHKCSCAGGLRQNTASEGQQQTAPRTPVSGRRWPSGTQRSPEQYVLWDRLDRDGRPPGPAPKSAIPAADCLGRRNTASEIHDQGLRSLKPRRCSRPPPGFPDDRDGRQTNPGAGCSSRPLGVQPRVSAAPGQPGIESQSVRLCECQLSTSRTTVN